MDRSTLHSLTLFLLIAAGGGEPLLAQNTENLYYFGQHMHRLVVNGASGPTVFPLPQNGQLIVGTLRTWDSGYGGWSSVAPSPGVYDWTGLDLFVNTALANGAQVVHTFMGITPTWASARPTEACPYGIPGCSAEPANPQDYTNYLTALFTRYRGKIKYYEVWNEPTFSGTPAFYTGTAAKLWQLHQTAYTLLKQIDPQAQLLGPGFVGAAAGTDSFSQYLSLTGANYRNFTDIVAFHYYGQAPESVLSTHKIVQGNLRTYGLDTMPIINTEAGFLTTDNLSHTPDGIDPAIFPGWLARSYILGLYAGIKRYLYYSYDGYSGLFSAKNTGVLNPAGVAQATVGRWLQGATLGECFMSGSIYICDVRRTTGGLAHLVWRSTDAAASFSVPSYWEPVAQAEALDGTSYSVASATAVVVSGAPILIKPNSGTWAYDVRDPVAPYVHDPVQFCNLPSYYATQVTADTPVAYYKMTSAAGTTIADSSGFGRDASISGLRPPPLSATGALYVADDGALNFNAGSLSAANGVSVPSSVNPWSRDFSIEFWANMESLSGQLEQLAFVNESYTVNGFRLGFKTGGLSWSFWTYESGGNVSLETYGTVSTGTWSHIALTYSQSAKVFTFYVNGEYNSSVSGGSFVPPAGGLSVGEGEGYYLQGSLDEVAVYDKVLSAARVRSHYQLGSNFCSPLLIPHSVGSTSASPVPAAPRGLRFR